MPAFTAKTAKLAFSVSFDGVTVYPNFSMPDMNEFIMMMSLCNKQIRDVLKMGKCSKELSNKLDFDRSIFHDDDDHNYYHYDNYDRKKDHMHSKFKSPLSSNTLAIIFKVYEDNGLITEDEKKTILESYQLRLSQACAGLFANFTGYDSVADSETVIKFISSCKDNDIINYINSRLLSNNLNYLRSILLTEKYDNIYQGTNADNKLVETSKEWAAIQKAISLQLAKNIKDECGKFTKKVAKERAEQLKSAYPFFAIKRKTPFCSNKFESSMYRAFSEKDDKKFEAKYTKYFR